MKNRINCWAHCIRLKAVAKTKKRGPCRPRKDEMEDLIYTLDTIDTDIRRSKRRKM